MSIDFQLLEQVSANRSFLQDAFSFCDEGKLLPQLPASIARARGHEFPVGIKLYILHLDRENKCLFKESPLKILFHFVSVAKFKHYIATINAGRATKTI